jgi:acetyl-CoA carboxylase biotin carboxyl carrier protein
MDLLKIKTLIDFVGQSNIAELTVTEKDTKVRIFRNRTAETATPAGTTVAAVNTPEQPPVASASGSAGTTVNSPIFGVLHCAPGPGEKPFIAVGDMVEAGQTLFIIEAMKVFNKISAPTAGRVARIVAKDGVEVEADDLLAEIV